MQLKLPRKQQVIIGSLFAGGIFVTAAGAVRTYIMFVLYSDPSKDLTWDAIPIILATTIELYLGIVSLLAILFVCSTTFLVKYAHHRPSKITDLCLHPSD